MTYYIVHFDACNWCGIFDSIDMAIKNVESLGPYICLDYTGDQEVWDIVEDDESIGYIVKTSMNSMVTDY